MKALFLGAKLISGESVYGASFFFGAYPSLEENQSHVGLRAECQALPSMRQKGLVSCQGWIRVCVWVFWAFMCGFAGVRDWPIHFGGFKLHGQ